MSLDQVLVETEVFIQKAKGRFDALGDLIDLSGLQTLVVNSIDAEHPEEMSGLGEKRVFINGLKDANVGVQRARLLIVLENTPAFNHFGCSLSPVRWPVLPGRIGHGTSKHSEGSVGVAGPSPLPSVPVETAPRTSTGLREDFRKS